MITELDWAVDKVLGDDCLHWAILSGIEGILAAYEAVLPDIRRQRNTVTDLFIIGDVVGLPG